MNVTIQPKQKTARPNQPRKKARNSKTSKNNKTPKSSNSATTSKAPVSINVNTKTRPPRMRQSRNGFTVTHKEYIGDITSSGASFAVSRYSVNPGLSGTFPWLSSIANRFESYLFDDLHFIYEPICPTSTAGSIMMAMDYDAADVSPSSKQALMSYAGADRTSPWDRAICNCKRTDLRKFGVQRYLRGTDPPTGTDVKTYDVGNFFIATQNTPPNPTSLGELYVSYTVRFMTPQISTGVFTQNSVQQTESQYTQITVPAGQDAVSLIGEYRGSGVNPLMWWDPSSANSINPILMFNLNALNNMLLSFRCGSGWPGEPGGFRAINFFNNMKFSSSVENSRLVWALKQLVFGFATQNIANNLFETYMLQGTNGVSDKAQGGIFPLPFKRPATGSYIMSIAAIPVAANYSGNVPVTGLIGSDYSFPPVALPVFNSVVSTKGGMRSSTTDDINTVFRLEANDEPLLDAPTNSTKAARSKLAW